jgi:hypothetical protein
MMTRKLGMYETRIRLDMERYGYRKVMYHTISNELPTFK